MNHLNIHCLQHVPFEGLGCIEQWIAQKGHTISYTRFYENYIFPDIAAFDWLIIMGGPMGTCQVDQFPWLLAEKAFIRKAIECNKTCVGICLGAQLVAEALGAKVYANQKKEIGWFPVYGANLSTNNLLFGEKQNPITVLHWHGDTFDLPVGAVHLAYTEVTPCQAYLYRNNVLGLQFHLELTEDGLHSMLFNCKEDLYTLSTSVQSESTIFQGKSHLIGGNEKLFDILDRLSCL